MLISRVYSLFALLLLFISSLSAVGGDCDGDIWIGLGFRQDQFRWSISGPNHEPDILSELEWKNLGMLEATALGWHSFSNGFYYRWKGSYAAIVNGKVTDSDYLGDNRTLLFSRSHSHGNRGRVFDLNGGIGWQFSFCNDGILVAVVGGYSTHELHLHMMKGKITFDAFNPNNLGHMPDLHSKYLSRWWGPWAGLDFVWQGCCEFAFSGGIEYHRAKYRGRGHWNLRSDFCGDFIQNSHGHGVVGRFGISYAFQPDWLFILNLSGQRWHAVGGTDTTKVRVFIADPEIGAVFEECVKLRTPFHEAQWWSLGAMLGIEYRY